MSIERECVEYLRDRIGDLQDEATGTKKTLIKMKKTLRKKINQKKNIDEINALFNESSLDD